MAPSIGSNRSVSAGVGESTINFGAGGNTNASAITTINTGVALSSRWQHARLTAGPLHFRSRIRSTAVANQDGMAGLFFQATLSGTAAVTATDSGFYWKWGTDGTIKPFNGAEVTLGTDVAASLNSANYYDFHVIVARARQGLHPDQRGDRRGGPRVNRRRAERHVRAGHDAGDHPARRRRRGNRIADHPGQLRCGRHLRMIGAG